MFSSLQQDGPVVFMEHKLLSETSLEFLGSGGRDTISYDIPEMGRKGPVPRKWFPIPLGRAAIRRQGYDLTIASIGVGVHRALEAADHLQDLGISTSILDLRTTAPLDKETLCKSVSQTGRLVVVDEDYESFGLSGELAAVLASEDIPFKFARVCTQTTIPYARHQEDATLPNTERICEAAELVM
jgi:pyruvate dehydrogenase E1 component beta subunit